MKTLRGVISMSLKEATKLAKKGRIEFQFDMRIGHNTVVYHSETGRKTERTIYIVRPRTNNQ